MDEEILKEIVRELKTLHNEAVELIKLEKFDRAKKLYEIASSISDMTGYRQGVGMSMFSISNLEILRQDYTSALDYALLAGEYYTEGADKKKASELIEKLSLHLVKKGIEMETEGKVAEALVFFNHALPYLKGKRKEAVSYEINLLGRIKDDE